MKKLSLIAMLAVLTLGVVACKPATSSSETPAPSTSQPTTSAPATSAPVSSEPEVATLPAPWADGETEYKTSSVALVPGEGQKAVKDFFTVPGIRFIDMRDHSEGYGIGHIQRFESISHFKLVAPLFNADFTPKYEESVDILNGLFPKDQTYFLMCQSGGRVASTIKILIKNGYDASKLYNVGGWNSIKDKADFGGYSVSLGLGVDGTKYEYDFSKLNALTTATPAAAKRNADLPAPWADGEAEYKTSSVALVPGEGQKAVKDFFGNEGIRFIDMRDANEGYAAGHIQNFESISHFKVVALLFNADFTPKYEESVDILNDLFPKDQTYFLMCQSGGRVASTIKLLIANGYDAAKLYNVGGWNSIKDKADFGGYSVSLGLSAVAKEGQAYEYDFSKLNALAA